MRRTQVKYPKSSLKLHSAITFDPELRLTSRQRSRVCLGILYETHPTIWCAQVVRNHWALSQFPVGKMKLYVLVANLWSWKLNFLFGNIRSFGFYGTVVICGVPSLGENSAKIQVEKHHSVFWRLG
ncbi:uncharacterized protein LOC107647871 isoform X2 [Arachis ipaensis]|uniref:uncharacterized protein LOC107647871 isoform X2 n=1 Tax=Arachis ipaensis TaxID=130454 RepID=UPI0007AF5F90|nr:uncharacterized protein LOC107647871 isoform X2 [Arachis ipaensis]